MSQWIEVAPLNDIPPLGSRVVRCAKGDIAIFRNASDAVFALHDHCPHKGGPLSQGIVSADKVTCPLHGWQIGLADGQAVSPDEGQTTCFKVKVDNGIVYLQI